MILKPGEKVLISHRRRFEEDHPVVFTGTVEAYENGIARLRGYSWVHEANRGKILRKDDMRTKIVVLSSESMMVYVLPDNVNIEDLKFEGSTYQKITLTDRKSFHMDMSDRESLSGYSRAI